MRYLVGSALLLVVSALAGIALGESMPERPFRIVDTPVRYGDDRIALTVTYRQTHQDPAIVDQKITPRAIVVHYTGGHSRKASFAYFDRLKIEAAREKQAAAGEVNVSAHFLVDRDGTVYRLVPEDWMARHCIGLNHVAIGIENVGDGAAYPLTAKQLEANAALVRDLVARYPTITHLLGHHEYRRMEGTELWLERDPNYRNQKPDPGPGFMKKLRARVADLKLQEPPAAAPKKKESAK